MEDAHVKHRAAESVAPKTAGTDVESCIRRDVGGSVKLSFTRQWYKGGLNLHVTADFAEKACCQVPNLIVAHDGISPRTTREGMVGVKWLTAGAVQGQVRRLPSIP